MKAAKTQKTSSKMAEEKMPKAISFLQKAIIIGVMFVGIVGPLLLFYQYARPVAYLEMLTMEQEIESCKKSLGPDKFSEQMELDSCVNLVSARTAARDVEIRRAAVIFSINSQVIILYVVVFSTFSGIILAAFQLLSPLRELAGSEMTNINATANSLGVATKYVGLAVLALSLLFFVAYAVLVYPVQSFYTQDAPSQPIEQSKTKSEIPAAGDTILKLEPKQN